MKPYPLLIAWYRYRDGLSNLLMLFVIIYILARHKQHGVDQ
jgi:hypothetical protein